MAYLTIRIRGEDGYTQRDLEGERLVLGRTDDCDLPLKHDRVSRQHCALIKDADGWSIEDLGSSNGTVVNNDKISQRRRLAERDIIKVGKARMTFHIGERADEKPASSGISIDPADLGSNRNADTRQRAKHEPEEAAPCSHCGAWLSIAHRLPADRMRCPACSKQTAVPQLIG